jgi:hypothetical protein
MSATPNIPPVIPETAAPSIAAAPVTNTRTAATGAIPKQMQSWIFLGIIAVVAVGLWFSGMGKKPKNTSGTGSATTTQAKPMVGGLTPDEVQKRLQESEDTRRTEAVNSRPGQFAPPSDARLAPDLGVVAPTATPSTIVPVTLDPIAEDERKREYAARFASNIALSYRADARPDTSAPHTTTNGSRQYTEC